MMTVAVVESRWTASFLMTVTNSCLLLYLVFDMLLCGRLYRILFNYSFHR